MALFNRGNKNKTEVPAEIQEYYETEKRDRTGMAWMLAIGTLILTILLAAGIFFAGRWAYRQIAGSDNGNNTSQSESQQQEQQTEEEAPAANDNSQQPEEERRAQEEERNQTEQEAREQEQQRAEEERQQAEEREAAEREEQREREVSREDSEDSAAVTTIPDTGPSETVAVFVAVSILAYLAHRYYLSRIWE